VLLHLVCFKYRDDVDSAARQDHRNRLQRLAGLETVVDLKVGEDVVRSARSFDTGLAVTFRDRAALDTYQADPQHTPVAERGRALCDQIVAVDFEF
jgi:hypothetical protein